MKKDSLFGSRLRTAFSNAPNTEIASKLGYKSKSPITKFMAGVIPPGEILIKISRITNYSIHWLLTGEGPERLSETGGTGLERIDLEELDYLFIRKLAAREHKDFDRMVRDLLVEALKARGSKMFANYERLTPKQLEELLLVTIDEEDETKGNNINHA